MTILPRLILLAILIAIFTYKPLFLALLLVLISMITALLAGKVGFVWWVFIFLLVISGGIIVIFIYMASLVQSFKPSLNSRKLVSYAVFLFFIYTLQDPRAWLPGFNRGLEIIRWGYFLLMAALYLTAILFLAVKISNPDSGSLKGVVWQ